MDKGYTGKEGEGMFMTDEDKRRLKKARRKKLAIKQFKKFVEIIKNS